MNRHFIYSVEKNEAGLSVEWFLRKKGYSHHIITCLKRQEDGILLNGTRAYTSQTLKEGDSLRIHLREAESSDGILPRPVSFSLVYEDEDLLVVDKPADVPVHPSIGNYENTLANGIAWYYKEKGESIVFRCINRLDRDTTGLTVLAKNALSGAILSRQMAERSIRRTYLALVQGITPKEGTIDAPIARKEGSVILRTVDRERGERAVTHFRTLASFNGCSLLELHLETGRTHQIRVHMSSIGHPLLGDTLYHPGASDPIARQALHSAKLVFIHPVTGERLTFTAPLPEDFRVLLPEHTLPEEVYREMMLC